MKAPRTLALLVEIGCEEIPARFLAQAQLELGSALEFALSQYRLGPFFDLTPGFVGRRTLPTPTYSTPRRLVVHVPSILERQPDVTEEVTGPPVKVAFDKDGKPTRAAESFALKNSANVADLIRVTTPKGEYLAVKKTTLGRSALELLSEILPSVIMGLSFPKSMYWVSKAGLRFARPIRWVLALLGEGQKALPIPFESAGVKVGDRTYGHRVMSGGSIQVSSFADYARKLRAAGVEFDPEKRRERIVKESKALLEKFRFSPVQDMDLLEWLVSSCEWPKAVLGRFDEEFLKLPREILITVMRDHQKYFAVEDRGRNLKPYFVTVLNLEPKSEKGILAGHERVLKARFKDAEFFLNSDQKVPFESRRKLLARVTYQEELGSYEEKVQRMKAIASEVCQRLEAAGKFSPVDTERALRAVELSKCDLTTQMVQEFPELQGVVGGHYAQAGGEAREVSEAIYDHYLPVGLDDPCPRTVYGAVVSLADKVDGVVSGFAIGHEPTGSSDPFALRRQGNGIVKVLVEMSLPISLKTLAQEALNSLKVEWRRPRHETFSSILEFFGERLRYHFETSKKLRYDTVRAVLAAGWDVPADALARAESLDSLRGSEDLEAVCASAKRIRNILTKSAAGEDVGQDAVDSSLLVEEPEKALFEAWKVVAERESNSRQKGDYRTAFTAIASLRPTVDKFFDKVLVMADDQRVRRNRLRLLRHLDDLFSAIAHFAEIATAVGANVDASTLRAGIVDPEAGIRKNHSQRTKK